MIAPFLYNKKVSLIFYSLYEDIYDVGMKMYYVTGMIHVPGLLHFCFYLCICQF